MRTNNKWHGCMVEWRGQVIEITRIHDDNGFSNTFFKNSESHNFKRLAPVGSQNERVWVKKKKTTRGVSYVLNNND